MMDNTRLICFYLPQFHPIPENDEWWGKGFTEWRNVTKAKPLFPGHYQPHLPADLGFYDLRLPDYREMQVMMAKEYGIYGFCYYHYWFNGKRILQRPLDEVLDSRTPEFPFCLCWANENWTRTWDGSDSEILLKQEYSPEDDREHIKHLIKYFKDSRYIRINGKPLLLIYRTELMPNPARTAELWRDECLKAGIGEIYLARVENFNNDIVPNSIGFDAAVEFAPNHRDLGKKLFQRSGYKLLSKMKLFPQIYQDYNVIKYDNMIEIMLNRDAPAFTRFQCVTPMWDNSARKQKGGRIIIGSTPEKYGYWLKKTIMKTVSKYKGDEQIVFINAWNEWGEGCHLEPDLKWGKQYLSATKNSLNNNTTIKDKFKLERKKQIKNPNLFKKVYWNYRNLIKEQIEAIKVIIGINN